MIHIPQFEGPIGLLLTLIERRRLPITELSLAAVADQYLRSLRASSALDQETLSEFLLIGARLVLLKSRALLSRPRHGTDEELEGVEELLVRLEAYRTFRLVAEEFGRNREPRAFPRGLVWRVIEVVPRVLAPLRPEELAAGLQRLGVVSPGSADSELAASPRVAVAERIAVVRAWVQGRRSIIWDLIGAGGTDEVVATLLAVLELTRRGELRVQQADPFGPIWLHGVGEPAESSSGRAGIC